MYEYTMGGGGGGGGVEEAEEEEGVWPGGASVAVGAAMFAARDDEYCRWSQELRIEDLEDARGEGYVLGVFR